MAFNDEKRLCLGAYPLTQDGFRFEIQYRDDQTGISSNVLQNALTADIPNTPLIQVLNLDQLDQSQFRNADGFFDYVEGQLTTADLAAAWTALDSGMDQDDHHDNHVCVCVCVCARARARPHVCVGFR